MEREQMDLFLPRQALEDVLGEELAKQYRLSRGEGCIYMPVSNGTDYLCTCGAVNPMGTPCAACGRKPELLERQVLDSLQEETRQRLTQEAEQRAIEEKQRALKEAQHQEQKARLRRKKRRRITAIVAAALGVLAVGAAVVLAIFQWAIPAYHYSRALDALEKKDYRLAHREFTLAGEHRDAQAYLERFYTPVLTARTVAEKSESVIEHTYDAFGRRIKTVEENLMLDEQGIATPGETWVYEQVYDAQGRILVFQNWYGKKEYSYYEQGQVFMETQYRADGQQKTTRYFNYWYDKQGRVEIKEELCIEHIQTNYSYKRTDHYTYDEAGNVIWNQSTVHYPSDSGSDSVRTTKWRYDAKGRLVEMVAELDNASKDSEDLVETETWTYDEKGKVLKHTNCKDFINDVGRDWVETETYTYNRRGDLTKRLTVNRYTANQKRDFTVCVECSYDIAGRLIRHEETTEYTDPEQNETLGRSYTRSCRYDLLGRLVEEVYAWDYPQPAQSYVETHTITYGSDGMRETARTVTEMGDATTEMLESFDENGMPRKRTYRSDNAEWLQEYTYAYFYYPEGTQMPTETTTGLLYG